MLLYGNNTYKAVRIIGKGYSYYYSVCCTNEHELYDILVRTLSQLSFSHSPTLTTLTPLPHQPHPPSTPPHNPKPPPNPTTHPSQTISPPFHPRSNPVKVTACTQSRHPASDIRNLLQALDVGFNRFYERQTESWGYEL
jgi:hypothetical protein